METNANSDSMDHQIFSAFRLLSVGLKNITAQQRKSNQGFSELLFSGRAYCMPNIINKMAGLFGDGQSKTHLYLEALSRAR